MVPTAVVPKSKRVPNNAARPVSTAIPKIMVTRPRQDTPVVTKPNSPPRRHINRIPSPKARNILYLSDFEELNGGYVAFGGNPKGGKFDGKVDKGILVGYSVSSKAFREFNSRTRIVQETLHVNFLENKPNVEENAGEEIIQQYVLFPVWSSGSINPQNTDGDVVFDEKETKFEGRKPDYEINVSPSSRAQSKKHDAKTKIEAKDIKENMLSKSPVESLTGYRNLSAKFEDFFDNSINEDNAADTLVPWLGKFPLTAIILLVPLVLQMLLLVQHIENLQVDFNNLETSIIVSLIPTIRVHKDYLVTQIIGDLSSATQTRKEPKMVHQALKDSSWIEAMQEELLQFKMQKVWVLVDFLHGKRAIGFEDPDYLDKVYKVVKDIYVAENLKKFGLTDGKLASTPIDTEKPLLKDPDGEDIDVHTYRSMIGSSMYLTSSRPDITFAVYACAHF
nr:ribonuclease H-like domain-containing protein [Tanacetum cinerariifolium]